jgi:hypothetical protein
MWHHVQATICCILVSHPRPHVFKKMVYFAIIVIFDHYYKFCNVFKVKIERKTIRNVPKPNVIVKIRNFITKLPVFPALRTRLLNIQTQIRLRDVLGTKLFYMWSGHVLNMKTCFQFHLLILCCFSESAAV